MPWIVEVSEYMGNGSWKDYAALTFDTHEEALDHEMIINMDRQVGGMHRVKKMYEVNEIASGVAGN